MLRNSTSPSATAHLGRFLLLALPALLAACGSGGGGGGAALTLDLVLQDLDLDPQGTITVVSFSGAAPAGLTPGNFESSGAQVATGVSVAGDEAVVTWDERVTPTSDVRLVGVAGIAEDFHDVETSDDSAPTYTIAAGVQGPGVGSDSFEVLFSGPHVVADEVGDLSRWHVYVDDSELDLGGTLLEFLPDVQVLSVQLGPDATLHASFEIAVEGLHSVADVEVAVTKVGGTAAGDGSAPALLAAEQKLDADPLGRVVDFTFDEPMSPLFATQLSDYVAGFPIFATQVELLAPELLRVSFTQPVVPGFNTVLLQNILDAHGNAFPDATTPISAGMLVANAFTPDTALVTVQNLGGDYLSANFDWAMVETTAEDYTHWTVECPTGTPLDISGETLGYDLDSRTLNVSLPDDYLNGQPFRISAAGVYSIDGNPFSGSYDGIVAGDSAAPAVQSVTQNRNVDSAGMTYDVLFFEDLEETTAEAIGSYDSTQGAAPLQTATLMADLRTVRLTTSSLLLPGQELLHVLAAKDLAGNSAAPQNSIAIGSTDHGAPTPGSQVAAGIEGPENDTLTVVFNDDMVPGDVTTQAYWHFESPIGTPVGTSLCSASYESATRTARLTFEGGDDINFQTRTDFQLSFTSMRDIGGNVVAPAALTGIVNAESNTPRLIAVYRPDSSSNLLHVRFSEPCTAIDDIPTVANPGGLTRYLVKDSGGLLKGEPASALLDADRLGAELSFGFVITPGSDTLDVRGVPDLAGNQMFALEDRFIESENSPGPNVSLVTASAPSGEDNDSIEIRFDKPITHWLSTQASNFDITYTDGGPTLTLGLSDSEISFDGSSTILIDFNASGATSLANAILYSVGVPGTIVSAQGFAPASGSGQAVFPGGDSTAPAFVVNRVVLDALDSANSVIMDLSEALDPDDAGEAALVDIAGVNPDTLQSVGPRTVRATFAGGVSLGQTINFSFHDLAGNLGSASQAIGAADASAPVLGSVAASIQADFGGDRILVAFDEPVEASTALDYHNYTVMSGGNAVDLSGSTLRYSCATNLVTLALPEGTELTEGALVNVSVSGMRDLSGNTMGAAASLNAIASGDATPPAFAEGLVNYREDAAGTVVDLRFSEDVDQAFAGNLLNYSASGGQGVLSALMLREDVVRLTLSAALGAGEAVLISGLSDPAGNSAGSISVDPLE